MNHPDDKHQIVLTDLWLAPEALAVILRDHLKADHGFEETGISFDMLVTSHITMHAISKYEEEREVPL